MKTPTGSRPERPGAFFRWLRAWLLVLLLASAGLAASSSPLSQATTAARVSKAESDRGAAKVAQLQANVKDGKALKPRTLRFSEGEVNSYLAFELKSKYHPSLRSLAVSFDEDKLGGNATVDFDHIAASSTKMLTRLLARMMSGTHTLALEGRLETTDGMGRFKLGDAKFDGMALPNVLVEEIISAVGRKQKPHFDPLSSSQMPFAIRRVEVHRGYIDVIQ